VGPGRQPSVSESCAGDFVDSLEADLLRMGFPVLPGAKDGGWAAHPIPRVCEARILRAGDGPWSTMSSLSHLVL
jgi:hypothetical protein